MNLIRNIQDECRRRVFVGRPVERLLEDIVVEGGHLSFVDFVTPLLGAQLFFLDLPHFSNLLRLCRARADFERSTLGVRRGIRGTSLEHYSVESDELLRSCSEGTEGETELGWSFRWNRTRMCRSPEGRWGAYEVTLTYELRNTQCSSYILNRLKE